MVCFPMKSSSCWGLGPLTPFYGLQPLFGGPSVLLRSLKPSNICIFQLKFMIFDAQYFNKGKKWQNYGFGYLLFSSNELSEATFEIPSLSKCILIPKCHCWLKLLYSMRWCQNVQNSGARPEFGTNWKLSQFCPENATNPEISWLASLIM